MARTLPRPPHMTVEEFLAWDDGTDTRYELEHGVPVAMAPAMPVHGRSVRTSARRSTDTSIA